LLQRLTALRSTIVGFQGIFILVVMALNELVKSLDARISPWMRDGRQVPPLLPPTNTFNGRTMRKTVLGFRS
jgi:hypothetical protein